MDDLVKYIEKRKKRSPKFARTYGSGYENFRIGWKEQLLKDVQSIRSEVPRKGGIKARTIDDAIKRYRKTIGASGA